MGYTKRQQALEYRDQGEYFMDKEFVGSKYHPLPDFAGNWVGGKRNSNARLDMIEKNVDFNDKTVLDLGCSGGFFSFSLAKKAKSITAIDANQDMINRNREIADRLGCKNIEFRYSHINPESLKELPKYDVVLFLSVFHHIIASSDTYEWNDESGVESAQEVLDTVSKLGSVYIFEMGRPDEGTKLGRIVGERIGEPRDWVPQNVFGAGFKNIQVLRGAGYDRWPFRWFPKLAPALLAVPERKILGRKVSGRRIMRKKIGIAPHDFREIYIGRR
jgi:SAM-dependent methyltransferase